MPDVSMNCRGSHRSRQPLHKHHSLHEAKVCQGIIRPHEFHRSEPVTQPRSAVPQSKVPAALLAFVPEGYYAVRPDASYPFTFLRISNPKRGQFKDCIKVQTQHGPNWDIAWVAYPDGRIHTFKASVEEPLLLTISDYMGAAEAYARELGKCCRCNTDLTDSRSLHYLIGPECEKHWPWMLVRRDEECGYKFGHKPADL